MPRAAMLSGIAVLFLSSCTTTPVADQSTPEPRRRYDFCASGTELRAKYRRGDAIPPGDVYHYLCRAYGELHERGRLALS